MPRRVWLITGASSGFGALLAEKALQAGHHVIALGRTWLQLDVTSKATKEQVEAAIKDAGGRIDVVINNAGYGLLGSIEDISEDELDTQFQTNIYGVVRVIKAVLPLMRAQRSGTIVNLSSIAGFAAGPSSAAYSMSKFAVEAGAFRTNFIRSCRLPAAGLTKDYEGTPLGATVAFFNDFAGKQPGDPIKAVECILDVIQLQGVGEGKGHLLRLPLGTDCFPRTVAKLDAVRQNLEEIREVAISTAVDSD
ncbi:hypothetical protein BDW74DRAFT_164449 [Aspergillus multicolor]|uniref:uncharacterized protein n=1 Tax=Aspergillus multicolor TaxID=41759 RepID=UPI003CCE16D3